MVQQPKLGGHISQADKSDVDVHNEFTPQQIEEYKEAFALFDHAGLGELLS